MAINEEHVFLYTFLLERASQEQSRVNNKTLPDWRERKRMKASEQINDGTSTPAAEATEAMQVDDVIASTLG
ncbi:hypothetical protein EVAR_70074_1 [Eumeta japonica]|uniref:Uncharacterized protein n=1 Tax=Eumeta variegata TaxID=151549 RepID=A0A4C2A8N1_EUMVA|nr:hypothetical protein EVAR_70074_1 [Eumeta japonica]